MLVKYSRNTVEIQQKYSRMPVKLQSVECSTPTKFQSLSPTQQHRPLASALRRPQIARSITTKLQCPSLPAPLAVNNEPNRGRYTSWSHNNTPRVFGKLCSVNIFSIVNALHFDSCFGGGLASKQTKLSENLKMHGNGCLPGTRGTSCRGDRLLELVGIECFLEGAKQPYLYPPKCFRKSVCHTSVTPCNTQLTQLYNGMRCALLFITMQNL